MPTAEEVFTQTFSRFLKNWTFITSLRQVAQVALPIAQVELAAINADFVERASVDPDYKKLIVKTDGAQTEWGDDVKRMLRNGMTESAITNASIAIDAASLVFAQSVLDDCALSYLRVSTLVNPADWDSVIREKKVAYASLAKPAEDVRTELIKDKLQQLERESLLKKVDLLFILCQPPKDYSPIGNYAFDRDRLERIDERRHGIIHKNGMTQSLTNIEDDLEFITKTANFLMSLVNTKYDVRLNPLLLMNVPTTPANGK